MSTYSPTATQLSTITVPDPGDPARADSIATPLKSLADGTAWLEQELVRQRAASDRLRFLSLLTAPWKSLDTSTPGAGYTYTDITLVASGVYAAVQEHRLVACATDGDLRVSNDWGQTWTVVSPSGAAQLNVAAANPVQQLPSNGYHCLTAGSGGKLYTTWNLGTWTLRPLLTQPGNVAYAGSIYGAAINPTTGTCVLRGSSPTRLFRSSYAGITWDDLGTLGFDSLSSVGASPGRFVAAGAASGLPKIMYSVDDGLTWQNASGLASVGGSTVSRVEYCAQADAFFAYQNGYLIMSTDGDAWVSLGYSSTGIEGFMPTRHGLLELINDGYGLVSAKMTWKDPDGSLVSQLAPVGLPMTATQNKIVKALEAPTFSALVAMCDQALGVPYPNQMMYTSPRIVMAP